MKGTTPLTPLPNDFKNRLRSVDPRLTDYLYSAEAYDAAVAAYGPDAANQPEKATAAAPSPLASVEIAATPIRT